MYRANTHFPMVSTFPKKTGNIAMATTDAFTLKYATDSSPRVDLSLLTRYRPKPYQSTATIAATASTIPRHEL